MQVYKQLSEIEHDPKTVLTIGTFDGIHLGHQEILNKLFERSRYHNARNFLITFNPHPRKVISKSSEIKILNTPEEKISTLEKLGLGNLFIINFTKEFSQQSPIEFIKNYLVDKIGLKEIVVGYDHKFGKGREGTYETLRTISKELKFGITMVDELKIKGGTVNSTNLRHAISSGEIRQANSYLGRHYSFSGTVISGDKRGKLLGYPTANINLDDNDKLLPGLGIYAAIVLIDNEEYKSLLSVGKRPTFYKNGEVIPEVYIYNFDKNIYGKQITVNVIEKIRSEEKFSSPEELISQMNKDSEAGIKIFNEMSSFKTDSANN